LGSTGDLKTKIGRADFPTDASGFCAKPNSSEGIPPNAKPHGKNERQRHSFERKSLGRKAFQGEKDEIPASKVVSETEGRTPKLNRKKKAMGSHGGHF